MCGDEDGDGGDGDEDDDHYQDTKLAFTPKLRQMPRSGQQCPSLISVRKVKSKPQLEPEQEKDSSKLD